MYEDRTFKAILDEMLSTVPPDVDKREGSIIYDALAPAALKLTEAYVAMDENNSLSHAQTSSGDSLRQRGADFGVDPKPAVAAVRKGLFFDSGSNPFDVPIGSRYSVGGLSFTVTEKMDTGQFKLTCDTAGTGGNVPIGALLPLDYVDGLASVTLTDVLVPGTDAETDDAFRERFFAHVRTPPTSGNRAAYRSWALEVAGVGDAYVEPTWNGPNTVKVYLLGLDKTPAAAGTVQDVKDYIDPDVGLGEGMGEGAAPAGALTTVVAAPAVDVNVAATVVLSGSESLSTVQSSFMAALAVHLASIAYSTDQSVKYARVGTLLLDTPGVSDYSVMTVNGGTGNVAVSAGAVAVTGTVTLDG